MNEIKTPHGIFTENKETGQTAQEVYDEWLSNKDKPVEPVPSTEDKIIVLETENAMLKQELSQVQDTLVFLLKQADMIPKEVI